MSGLQAFGDILTPDQAQEPILARPVRNALMEWLQEYWAEKDLKAVGLTPRKRAMFSGVPGTGKTTLAHHIAARLGLPMLVVRSEKLQSSYVSASAKAVGQLFDAVRAQPKPVFLFFDEFDSVAAKRMDSGRNELGEQDHNLTINVLLSHFDRHDGFIVAATNYAARVDEALWRRFEIQIDIETPGDLERRHIIARYLAPFVLPEAALAALSEALDTATPALIRQFCEHIKRQVVVGPKAGWDMDRAAVISRLIASVQPHPEAGKPRIWSHGAADKSVARMPWPLARRLEDYPPAAAPCRVDGAVDLAARRAAEAAGGKP